MKRYPLNRIVLVKWRRLVGIRETDTAEHQYEIQTFPTFFIFLKEKQEKDVFSTMRRFMKLFQILKFQEEFPGNYA